MKTNKLIKNLGLISSLALGILIPCLIYFYFYQAPKSQATAPLEMINKQFPDSDLSERDSNINFSGKIKEGKVLVIFLQSKCPACLKDMEIISNNYSKLDRTVKIYGITIESKETIKDFISAKKIQFPILFDNNAELYQKLPIKYFPTKFLLQDGVVLDTWVGNFPNEDKMFEQLQITK